MSYEDAQRMAAIRDGLPRLWMSLYQGSVDSGFSKEQAFILVQTWILAQNPKGIRPVETDGPEPDDV